MAITAVRGQAPAPAEDMNHPQGTNAGIFAFTANCASCHDSSKGGAPDRYTLNRRTPEEVLAKISTGAHAQHAQNLSEFQKRVVAVYVGGRPLGSRRHRRCLDHEERLLRHGRLQAVQRIRMEWLGR